MRRFVLLLPALFAVPAAVAFAGRAPRPAPWTAGGVRALVHATVIDGTGAAPLPDRTVLVRGSRIEAVFPSGSRPLPRGAEVVDLRGRYLIPGLIDAHVHLGTQVREPGVMAQILRRAFMGGVTAVRDMGGSGAMVTPLQAAARPDTGATPRIYAAAIVAGPGGWFDGERGVLMAGGATPGESPRVRRVDERTDVARVVREARESGAAGIKIYNRVPPALAARLIAEAHRQGLRAWSHLWVDPGRPGDLFDAGVDVVSHADMFIAQVYDDSALPVSDDAGRARRHQAFLANPPGSPAMEALIARMRRGGTMLEPTLTVMRPRPDSTGAVSDRATVLFAFAAGMTARAHRAGVPIVAGTDALGGSTPNLHVELQLLVDRAGLTPLEAVVAATRNAARALGADSLGTIERGKVADLVVLSADPTRDIANTQTVVAVMRAGRLYPRPAPMPAIPGARPALN